MSWSSEGWVVVVVGGGGGVVVVLVVVGGLGRWWWGGRALDSPEQMLISPVRWCDWFKFNNADLDWNRCANGLEEIVKNACEFGEVCN
ncbi:hypothetical protein Hanom_Chr04g00355171 [Helianthus anomalus]